MKSRHRLVLAAWVRCTALGTRASERSVAIKILPEQLSKDPTRKQRFEREAKTISSFIVGFREGIRMELSHNSCMCFEIRLWSILPGLLGKPSYQSGRAHRWTS